MPTGGQDRPLFKYSNTYFYSVKEGSLRVAENGIDCVSNKIRSGEYRELEVLSFTGTLSGNNQVYD